MNSPSKKPFPLSAFVDPIETSSLIRIVPSRNVPVSE